MSAVLHYFNGRGKAEIIRLTMAATGVKWTQVEYTEREPFEKLKTDGKLLFQQLPLIEFEGKNMVQSGSTTRFFAKRGHLLGDNDDDAYKIDCLFEGSRDFLGAFMRYGFEGYQEVLDNAKKTAMPRYMPVFEKELANNGPNGHLVGNKLTLADVGLLEVILLVDELLGSQELEAYPNIKKFLTTMKSIPAINAYLSGPQRHRKNDDKYVSEVKRVLNW